MALLLPDNCYIGKIIYDFDMFKWDTNDNLYRTIMTKRKSFEFEQEIRAILPKNEYLSALIREENDFFKEKENIPKVIEFDININDLIENIYVNPKADNWFYNIVQNICDKYNLDIIVKKSKMNRDNVRLL